ncbi:MAG: AAA family ATPase [Pseudomonadota bacterium]
MTYPNPNTAAAPLQPGMPAPGKPVPVPGGPVPAPMPAGQTVPTAPMPAPAMMAPGGTGTMPRPGGPLPGQPNAQPPMPQPGYPPQSGYPMPQQGAAMPAAHPGMPTSPYGQPGQQPSPHPAMPAGQAAPMQASYGGAAVHGVAAAQAQVMPDTMDREGGERALPQLSIHAFCDHNETASCINQMTRDWRMRRTNTKIYMGGLQAAIDFYHQESTPGLIMIESSLRGPDLLAQLETLASVCDEGTRVVVIGAVNDIRLYRQLMDKGVSDYMVPPLHPLNMIRSLSDIYSDPEKPFTGRAIAFYGSKGGVGSSTLAHNIAWTLSERLMQETSLIDLDSSWGTTALDFAYDSASGLEEALADADRLDETLLDRIMVRHTPRLSLLPTSSSLNVTPVTDSRAYEAIITAVRSISPLALLDVPHIWNEWTTNVLTTVDDVVITTVPDLANLRNTKNLIDFLKAQRPHDTDPILVLNQTGRCKIKEDEISVENFAGAVGLDPALVIGFDPDTFNKACNEGKMLPEMKSTEALVPGLDYLAHRLRTGEFPAPEQSSGSSRLKLGGLGKSKGGDGEGSQGKSLLASLFSKKA